MKSKIISSTLVILGFVLGATALSAVAAWTAPASTPPNCTSGQPGCDAPINVSASSQSKLGLLTLQSNLTDAFGLAVANGIKLVDSSVTAGTAAGKVLTSDANGVGTWQPATGGGAGGNIVFLGSPTNLPITTSGTGSVPAGASAVILEAVYIKNGSLAIPDATVTVSKNASSPSLTLMKASFTLGTGSTNSLNDSNQGIFPVDADGSFKYSASGTGLTLRIIGYFINGTATVPGGLVVGGYQQDTMSITNWWGVGTSGGCPEAYEPITSGSYNNISYLQCLTK